MLTRHLRTLTTTILAALLLASPVVLTGCEKDKDEAGEEARVDWPEKPADGRPVAVEFLELIGEGEELAGNVRLFNFSDRTVKSMGATLHYLDADGNELKDFPWGMVVKIKPEGHTDMEVGAFVPPETKTIRVEIDEVEFTEGERWTAPETDAPAE